LKQNITISFDKGMIQAGKVIAATWLKTRFFKKNAGRKNGLSWRRALVSAPSPCGVSKL